MDHGQQHHHHEPPFDDHNSNWHDNGVYHPPQHQPSVPEFNGMQYTPSYAPLPMEPIYGHPHTNGMHPPRTAHTQLQPLIMPSWPSLLTSQSSYAPSGYPHPAVPITPASATPVSASSTHSRTSTPRKTLTDQDRRRMCQYHEDHPNVKQTEIGAMFGVERSTVSKVLRQKEKYLQQDDGSRSPIRKAKGKCPDIERALVNWARNRERRGLPLSDHDIRVKATFFANTVGNSESHVKANSASWLEKFKHKNNLGSKSRKGSLAEESEGNSNPTSNAHTPGAISPMSPDDISPSALQPKNSEDNLKVKPENSDSFDFPVQRRPFHSQSHTSLSSAFTDTAPSTFSAGPTSPATLSSPFFTPDSAVGQNPFANGQQSRAQPGNSSFQRPRSQTFPSLVVGVEQYMSPPTSSEALTPKFANTTTLDSPMAEARPSLPTIDDIMEPTSLDESMRPPPVPPVVIPNLQHSRSRAPSDTPDGASPVTPSQEEAARALELVMSFFQQQPQGFVEPQEYVMIGKLMEKLKIKRSTENLASIRHIADHELQRIGKAEAG
ncbi:hypothetical protein M011DRAFT_76258 [Sporormia fimetaria CBS 119925]|uniref:HTH CENPB-type domain-containing protein n=1 Tax=Sporormia fimetaria CBS 119925 TaxID=1340428 RepID=A0A6A6VAE2_9PLEO|nr:hypothetical protein M011DRAFT_76258 [Sporormia fimetaria CBS 119925]